MTLRKFVTYLKNVGLIFFALYFIASLALYHTTDGFKQSDALGHLLHIGGLFLAPLVVYEFWHFREYKQENKERLILAGLMFVVALLFIIFKRS